MRKKYTVVLCSLMALALAQAAQVSYLEGDSGSLPFHGKPKDEDKVDWSIDYQNLRAHIISVEEGNPRKFEIQGKGSRIVFNPLTGHIVLLGGTNSRLTLAPEVDSIVLYGCSIRRNPDS